MLYTHNINLYTKSDAWIKELIKIVEPEIIICEGKTAFNRITNSVLKCTYNWNQEFGYTETPSNIHVLGYARKYSNIKNKKMIADKIKEIVKITEMNKS